VTQLIDSKQLCSPPPSRVYLSADTTRPYTNMEVSPFQYRPLEPGQIRILDLAPDATARVRHVDLKKSASLRYIALSYTWGSSTVTFPFECDSQDLPVRENLLLALMRLRYVLEAPIWIDAMCINQEDEHEKMGQIQFMTDIYKKAERVLVSAKNIRGC
jgi:hypothetical protein